ncbi:MAG: RES domain-containing protein [Lapillicoccus sp.]
MSRQVVAQQPPSRPLGGFPSQEVTPAQRIFRAHSATFGPWWFGSDGGGRFDLPAPRGTCYLADAPLAALRERIGVVLGGSPAVPASLLAGAVVSALHLPAACRLADLQAPRASTFGVTRELESMVPYAVPQAWARALDTEGFGGVAYGPRFSTGAATSYAIFGPGGAAEWGVDPSPVAAVDVPGAPLAMEPPRRWDVTVVRPPRTRPR